MDAEAERLAAAEDAAWVALHGVFDLVPHHRFEEPHVTSDGWSPKDTMFHVAAWCAECAIQLERMRMGTYVDPLIDTDSQNREWFEISRGLDTPTVKAELHASRTRMRQVWCELSEQGGPTADAIEWFEESGPIHYREHLAGLMTWLERS